MFKSWQIFVFSLVPLALVFAGVIIGSIHGSDSDQEIFPTPPPRPTAGPPPSPPPGATALQLVAQDQLFNSRSLSAAAGRPVQIQLDNRDATISHNVAFYTNSSATSLIHRAEIIVGPAQKTETFNAPASPGTYFFRCDVHPDTMTGTFQVR